MKKIGISILIIAIITLTVAVGLVPHDSGVEYLRIHIRANSNSEEDQSVKYLIKDAVVSYATPYVAEMHSKEDATEFFNSHKTEIENLIDNILKQKGFSYGSNLVVRNEKFPTRVYGDFTLEEGFYDAVIVELGSAKGDNWWCVVYPPLCFTGNSTSVKYKSKILEIIEDFKKKQSK